MFTCPCGYTGTIDKLIGGKCPQLFGDKLGVSQMKDWDGKTERRSQNLHTVEILKTEILDYLEKNKLSDTDNLTKTIAQFNTGLGGFNAGVIDQKLKNIENNIIEVKEETKSIHNKLDGVNKHLANQNSSIAKNVVKTDDIEKTTIRNRVYICWVIVVIIGALSTVAWGLFQMLFAIKEVLAR